MPLLTWKEPTSRKPLKNQQIAFMYISCNPKDELDAQDPRSASFGWTAKVHECEAGTRTVASATLEHISIDTVNAFSDFYRWHLTPYFQAYDDQGGDAKALTAGSTMPSEGVLGEITKAKWTQSLAQWKAEKEDVSDELELTLWKASSGLERMGLTQEDSWRLRQVLDRGLSDQVLARMRVANDELSLVSQAGDSGHDQGQHELEERESECEAGLSGGE